MITCPEALKDLVTRIPTLSNPLSDVTVEKVALGALAGLKSVLEYLYSSRGLLSLAGRSVVVLTSASLALYVIAEIWERAVSCLYPEERGFHVEGQFFGTPPGPIQLSQAQIKEERNRFVGQYIISLQVELGLVDKELDLLCVLFEYDGELPDKGSTTPYPWITREDLRGGDITEEQLLEKIEAHMKTIGDRCTDEESLRARGYLEHVARKNAIIVKLLLQGVNQRVERD